MFPFHVVLRSYHQTRVASFVNTIFPAFIVLLTSYRFHLVYGVPD